MQLLESENNVSGADSQSAELRIARVVQYSPVSKMSRVVWIAAMIFGKWRDYLFITCFGMYVESGCDGGEGAGAVGSRRKGVRTTGPICSWSPKHVSC